jgi:hypothetical protein
VDGLGNGKVIPTVSNLVKVTQVLPREFSQGGEDIVIYGSGFEDGDVVSVGTLSCSNVKVFNDRIECNVPANSDGLSKLVKVGTATCSDQTLCNFCFFKSDCKRLCYYYRYFSNSWGFRC